MNPGALSALTAAIASEQEAEDMAKIVINIQGTPIPPTPEPGGLSAFQSDTFQNDAFE